MIGFVRVHLEYGSSCFTKTAIVFTGLDLLSSLTYEPTPLKTCCTQVVENTVYAISVGSDFKEQFYLGLPGLQF